jgi:hypothetical protein
MSARDWEHRQEANDASRNRANHHRQEWSELEDGVVLLWDGHDAGLDDVAELLSRTREACRQRYYQLKNGRAVTHTVTRTTTTVTTTTTAGWSAEDLEEWGNFLG